MCGYSTKRHNSAFITTSCHYPSPPPLSPHNFLTSPPLLASSPSPACRIVASLLTQGSVPS
ncbi:hypothetical protein E2C01_083768 [Portunus trituberculatus]|uniref:Uncharacterized protein n=1 Tax=Portunus trituberculatus TaxID=210409 RepID=A0A5B7J5Q4_PORTR|nr:hypothetical protein [Portunus trituberculatus]